MLDAIVEGASRLGPWIYVILFLIVALECQVLFGLFMPGETAVLACGFLAGQEILNPLLLILVVALAAIVGDSVGYEMGRRLGRGWLRNHGRWFGVRESHLERVDGYFRGHGGKSVFASHFMHLLRSLMPFMAGASHMQYRRFFVYNAAGCVLWAAVFTLLGYFFGESWHFLERTIGRASVIAGGFLLLVLALVWIGRWMVRNEVELKRTWRGLMERPIPAAIRAWWVRQRRRLQDKLSPQAYLALQLFAGASCLVLAYAAFGRMVRRLVTAGPLTALDERIAAWFYEHQTPGLTTLMTRISFLGTVRWIVAIGLVLAVIFFLKRRWYRLLAIAAVLPGGAIIDVILKLAFYRPRPDFAESALLLQSSSFPSGHAMGATLLYGFLAALAARNTGSWRMRVLSILAALLLVVLVDLSRVYLALHYLTDVLGGTFAGLVWLALCVIGISTLRRRRAGRSGPIAQPDCRS